VVRQQARVTGAEQPLTQRLAVGVALPVPSPAAEFGDDELDEVLGGARGQELAQVDAVDAALVQPGLDGVGDDLRRARDEERAAVEAAGPPQDLPDRQCWYWRMSRW
jgi:hypothetical protein